MALPWQPNLGKKVNQNWNKLGHLGPMQTTFGICIQRICLGSLNSLILNTFKSVLPWQQNFEKISKNFTDFTYIGKYQILEIHYSYVTNA